MPNNREAILKIAVGAVVALFLADRFILTPSIDGWREQGERLAALREKVEKGRNLIEREDSLRNRWKEMLAGDMPDDKSAGEADVYAALQRWSVKSRASFTSLTPAWHPHEDGYDTFECRVTATGDQVALGRLMYEIETDPLPGRIEECEISTRDAQGKQLSINMRFSFVHINDAGREAR